MRILVVEDVPAFANAIAEGLRDHGMAVDAVRRRIDPLDAPDVDGQQAVIVL